MKRLLFILCLLFPSIVVFSKGISIDGQWAFRTDPLDKGVAEAWFSEEYDFSKWDRIEVPGCWNTRIEYSDYVGTAWYATYFSEDEDIAGKDVILEFEGVYSDTEVWLNGRSLGTHDFGFTSFRFDITDLIVPGGKNRLVLRVNNRYKVGATWNWGGIRRPVTVSVLPKQRISDVYITAVPDLKKKSADVGLRVLMLGSPSGVLFAELIDNTGKCVSSRKIKIDRAGECFIKMQLPHAKLWDFDHPNLYTARVTLTLPSGVKDVYEDRFGVRKIEIDGYKVLLNGQSIRLNGANWVPYEPFTGNTLPEEIYKRDIDLLKGCGVNMARLSHVALPDEVLDYIDEKGILIFEEIPLWNKNHYVKTNHPIPMRWLTELVTERYNHPCIIGWSVGNEIGRFSDNPDITGYISSAFRHVRSLDSTRLVTYVSQTAAGQYDEPVKFSDIIMYNQYASHGARVDEVNRRYPGKPIFYSEYGSKVNNEDANNSIVDYASMMNSMRGRDFLVGASVWTFNDYRTHYRDASTAPTGNRPWGVVDVYGNKKRGYKALQRENSPLADLDFEVMEGGTVNVKFKSRDRLDLPAYVMDGYSLRLSAIDFAGDTLFRQTCSLPVMEPDGKIREKTFSVPAVSKERIAVDLLSPVGYVVHNVVKSLAAPDVPKIVRAEAGKDVVRVWFETSCSADEYFALLSDGKHEIKSELTINDYIEVGKLEYDRDYCVKVVAVNDLGETVSGESLTVRTQAAELPPVLRHLSLQDGYICIGYGSTNAADSYEFEFGLSPDSLDNRLIVSVQGACRLPAIDASSVHYLRFRKYNQYGYSSLWSPVYAVRR